MYIIYALSIHLRVRNQMEHNFIFFFCFKMFIYHAVNPHVIDCDGIAIEFERKVCNMKEDPDKIFRFQPTVAYIDEEFQFVVLELSIHSNGVPFPPPLICFGDIKTSDAIHLVGHPGRKQMMEDSDIIPKWSPDHDKEINPYIRALAEWSKECLPKLNGVKTDYYSVLLAPPRKIIFHTFFNEGSSGSPGVTIRDEKPCVVLMIEGGTPGSLYTNQKSALLVEDWCKVEYGFAMSDIYKKMLNSPQKSLASNIFREII